MYKNGDVVKKGTYWNLTNGKRIDVQKVSNLKGKDGEIYYRIPVGIMLILGPISGLLYVICFPFIGMLTLLSMACKKVFDVVLHVTGASLSFGWLPKESYLTGKKKKEK